MVAINKKELVRRLYINGNEIYNNLNKIWLRCQLDSLSDHSHPHLHLSKVMVFAFFVQDSTELAILPNAAQEKRTRGRWNDKEKAIWDDVSIVLIEGQGSRSPSLLMKCWYDMGWHDPR
jgi:hypothetical protein